MTEYRVSIKSSRLFSKQEVSLSQTQRKKSTHENQRRLFDYLCRCQCAHCGENDPLVLEFDLPSQNFFTAQRTKRTPKKTDVSKLIRSETPWKEILTELKKLRVLCANCARKVEMRRANSYRYRMSKSYRMVA